MPDTLVVAAAWLAVVAIMVSAVVFGQVARAPSRRTRDERAARNRRIGTALSISGPVVVVLLAVAGGLLTDSWLIVAVVAFAAIGVVALTGLILAPH